MRVLPMCNAPMLAAPMLRAPTQSTPNAVAPRASAARRCAGRADVTSSPREGETIDPALQSAHLRVPSRRLMRKASPLEALGPCAIVADDVIGRSGRLAPCLKRRLDRIDRLGALRAIRPTALRHVRPS